MRNTILAISIFGLFYTNVFCEQKIYLEEDRVTLYDDAGKAVESVCVSRSDNQREELIQKSKNRIKGFAGINAQKTVDKERYYKVEALDQPRIRFVDDKNEMIKEISLKEENKTTKDNNYQRNHFINRSAVLSPNQKYAGLLERKGVRTFNIGTAYENEISSDTSMFTLYDENGNILWQKINVNDFNFSKDSKRIGVIQWFGAWANIDGFNMEKYREKLTVMDITGKELYVVDFYQSDGWGGFISDDGRYGGIPMYATYSDNENRIRSKLYFDIESKKTYVHKWKFNDPNGTYATMSDNGIIEITKWIYDEIDINGIKTKKWKESVLVDKFKIGEK
ncbi:MAG: hypothetical protein A2252_02720 [Elusimicrobia bacterium RIFOXYA2_FULL_39_19]|nr:MAG: hypothetical protein A2252_02720 [Elusimicrobia bacterium RIFOXYA2_FULL_39_19]